MNKLDSLYYEAVVTAEEEGKVAPEAVRVLHENARKFAIIDEPGDAVRFYERLFSLWRTLCAKRSSSISAETSDSFKLALNEYIVLLEKLERHERAEAVRRAL
jgi:hypothetical protein